MEVWRDRGRQLADNCHKEGRSQAFLSSLSYTVAHSELRQKQVVGQISSGCLSLAAKYKETVFFFLNQVSSLKTKDVPGVGIQ